MNVAGINDLITGGQARANDEGLDGDAVTRRHHAWQSAMEQAQIADWFKPSPHPSNPAKEQEEASERPAAPLAAENQEELPEDPGRAHSAAPVSPRSATAIAVSQALQVAEGPDIGREISAVAHASQHAQRSATAIAVAQALEVAERPGIGSAISVAAHESHDSAEPPPAETADTPSPEISPAAASDLPSIAGSIVQPLSVETIAAEVQRFLSGSSSGPDAEAIVPLQSAVLDTASALLMGPLAVEPTVLKTQPLRDASSMPLRNNVQAPYAQTRPMAPQPPRTADVDLAPSDDDEPMANVRSPIPVKADKNVETAAPLRVHVDLSNQGASVWLGVDGDLIGSVPGLVRHLDRWLAASGVRLAALVCNGRMVNPNQSTGDVNEYQRHSANREPNILQQADAGGFSKGLAHAIDLSGSPQAHGQPGVHGPDSAVHDA
jgi:hypothetical protein